MEITEIISKVDHTLLRQDATWEQIRATCDEGMKCGTASVCIPPSYVKAAAEYLRGRLPICTVIGFPKARYLRIRATELGTPASDEPTVWRLQFKRLAVRCGE